MKRALIIIAALVALNGTARAEEQTHDVRILALGDSYTAGTGSTPKDAWPWVLTRQLREDKIRTADPVVIAGNGWSSEDLLAEMKRVDPKGPFDLVFVLIGVNNEFRQMNIDKYRTDLIEIFKKSLALAGGDRARVIAVSIPDYAYTPFGAARNDQPAVSGDIARYNSLLRGEAKKLEIRVVNITQASRQMADDSDLVANDGLHPSASMHKVWARLVYPYARSGLKLRMPVNK